jgi:hypothetical protein
MKYAAVLLAAFVLSGCARMSDRLHGSWLDQVGKPASPPVAISDERAAMLTAEVLRLRAESEEIRRKLSNEKDRVQRVAHLRDLRVVRDRLRPVERVLQDARRTVPALTSATPTTATVSRSG